MSIFGKIKDAIFGHDAQAATPQTQATPQAQAATPVAQPAAAPASAGDVDARLSAIAAQKGAPSNYKTSIVDLMKLLDLDSSLDNRKELATELGYSGALDGSAEMNIWLHKQVMESLAKRGG